MKKQTGTINGTNSIDNGNNNVQIIGGDYIVTEKVVKKTEVKHDADLHLMHKPMRYKAESKK